VEARKSQNPSARKSASPPPCHRTLDDCRRRGSGRSSVHARPRDLG
jgi:hypothetical protein